MTSTPIKIEIQGTPGQQRTLDPTKNEQNPRFKSAVEKANIFSLIYFTYVVDLVKSAFKTTKEGKLISAKNLISFPWSRRADVLSAKFTHHLNQQRKENPKAKLNLTWAILKTVKWAIVKIIFIETCFIFTRLFAAWVLKKLVDCYLKPSLADDAWMWAGILSACLIVAFHFEHHFNHLASFFPNHIQNALINLVFEKITRLSTDSLTKISTGRLINVCTNGVNIFEQIGAFVCNVFVGIIALIASAALLWQFFGVYCLAGFAYVVFWYPLQQIFIIISLRERDRTNVATANRIRMTSEAIEAIRLLKMYTWEMNFKDKISALRKIELKMFKRSAITTNLFRGLNYSTQVCSTFFMFLAYNLSGHELEASSVFAAFYIMSYLRLYSSYFFGLALSFLTDARILIKGIEQVLETPEIGEVKFEAPVDPKNAVEYNNFSAYWNAEDAQRKDSGATLSNINLHIKRGSLNALVGAVGSGKTSLLMTFTGEIPKTLGTMRYNGNIAFVEQEPTIFAGTFRENVCFYKPYEPEFYKTVVKACNLESDLKLFPQGDLSEIGEKGNNLSGGQKARLALARAVYSQADIYLLDDPLSAVDPKVARSIFSSAIEKVLKGKTILLTTHQVDFARSCENIVLMADGHVLGSGTYEELKQQGVDVDKVFGNKNNRNVEEQEDVKPTAATNLTQDDKEDLDNQEGADDKQVKKDQYTVIVTPNTYLDLVKEMGSPWFFFLVFLIYLTCEFANMGYARMLGAWISGTFDRWVTLNVLGCLVAYDVVIYIVKYLILSLALIRAAKKYHTKMLDKVVQSTVLFFDTNPIGQILSRFSNDIGILDRYIPLAVMDIFNVTFFFGSVVITAAILNPILIGPYAGGIIVMAIIIYFCFPAVKQTKLYEMRSKGPLFGLLSATLSGIVIVRVYKQADAFQQKFKEYLHNTMKANNSFVLASRFIAIYVDMIYTILSIGCVWIITAKAQGGTIEEAGLAAFALSTVLSFNGILQFALKQFSQMIISISAVARIQSYLNVPAEPPLAMESDKQHQNNHWPQKGEIDFHKVYMKYRPEGDHVIRDLSLHVEAGQKIGCVGRTGAGKSTIIQLLYRMQEIDRSLENTKESFIKMDHLNTQEVGLHLLRNNISIIPQTPFIFTGSIRLNVDPLGHFTDEQIWAALEDVRLKQHVEKQPKKLDTHIHGGTSVFSAGQKQLVCLARAILKKSNVLIMDEATANMDYDTDFFVQKKIEERFAHATQFTIAHRLQTIANYDKVLVLDRGRKMEFDEPYRLLVNNIGDTEATNVSGYFTIMVQNTGPISSKKIFEIAKDAYFKRHPETK